MGPPPCPGRGMAPPVTPVGIHRLGTDPCIGRHLLHRPCCSDLVPGSCRDPGGDVLHASLDRTRSREPRIFRGPSHRTGTRGTRSVTIPADVKIPRSPCKPRRKPARLPIISGFPILLRRTRPIRKKHDAPKINPI